MSAFLGPIHFWLYNKIGKQEELTAKIAAYAEQEGWIEDQIKYIKVLPALQDVIDESNIHGWLQTQIHDAETRYAELIGKVMSDKHKAELYQLAFEYGKANAIDQVSDPSAAYKAFDDFFVNGMPCDRVNTIVSESDDEVVWQMTQDIHVQYWNDGSEAYYSLRNEIMRGMLEGTGLGLDTKDNTVYTIKRK